MKEIYKMKKGRTGRIADYEALQSLKRHSSEKHNPT